MKKEPLLIQKFLKGTISELEKEQLKIWVNTKEENSVFFTSEIKAFSKKTIADFDAEAAFERFYGTIQDKRNKKSISKTVLKYAAVVTVLLTIGFFAKNQLAQTLEANTTVVSQENERKEENKNITITLSDGSTKSINQNGEEVLKDSEGKIIANKASDILIFNTDSSSNTADLVFNEIFIPKGQTFKIKLADGTLVWLNADSKLRFPQSFGSASETRTVYLTGEAFFEVTKNEKQPFIVNANDVNVKVLGTQFNVSSYETDHAIATTLVEGSVSIFETSAPENKLQLTPSFQANFDKSNGTLSKQKVDTAIYTSWMQNRLYINGLNFLQILKKLERMHNVSFINNAPGLDKEVYQGEFENETIESILKTIALSTPFTYKIEQNIITINQ